LSGASPEDLPDEGNRWNEQLTDSSGISAPKVSYRSARTPALLDFNIERAAVIREAGAHRTAVEFADAVLGWHLLGTARMAGPANRCRRWVGARRPTVHRRRQRVRHVGRVNPTSTSVSLALRIIEHLIQNAVRKDSHDRRTECGGWALIADEGSGGR